MQVQNEIFQDVNMSQSQTIQRLRHQVEALTAENSALREQLARKEQFTAMVVHELRNPLSPIISYAQILSRHSCETPAAEEGEKAGTKKSRAIPIQRSTGIIISQAKRLTRLVNDLLDSTQLNAGRFALERERCDLSRLVQEVVDEMRPVAPHHTLVVALPDEPVIGNWDSERLQQVLGNLLDNAVKYSDEGTTVTTRLWTTPERAAVSVHNQGTGIPSADVELLFQPCSRLKATRARRGLGLGLYIAQSILEAHGGQLYLEPSVEVKAGEPSRGTTFIFDLPL